MSENESRGKSKLKAKKKTKPRKKRTRGGKYLLSERGQIGHRKTIEIQYIFYLEEKEDKEKEKKWLADYSGSQGKKP